MSAAVPRKDDDRWVTSAVLAALAARGQGVGDTFTGDDLLAWVPRLTKGNRKQAAHRLLAMGFVTHVNAIGEEAKTCARYTVTVAGAAGIKAITTGKPLTSGPKGPHQVDRTVGQNTFAMRLWALMRARMKLDSETAASTLVDAGGDVAKAAKNAQRYFARWASTGAIEPGRVREPNGCVRYVLVKDCGPTPPQWTPKAKARAAAHINQ